MTNDTEYSVIQNTCIYCNTDFYSKNINKKYCSRSCEGKHYRRIKGLKPRNPSIIKKDIKCHSCGRLFNSYNKTPKFCSLKCKGDYQSEMTDIESAIKMYEEGMTQQEIADELNFSQKVIYNLFKRNGYKCRIAAKRNQWGELNHNWSGNDAVYTALHKRIYNARGKAFMCEECGRSDDKISYDWANQTGDYWDINDFKMMCRSCHFKKDGHKANFPNNNLIPNINIRKLIDGKL